MIESQLLLASELIFTLPYLVPQSTELFLTLLSSLIYLQPLPCLCLLRVHSILLQNQKLKKEKFLTRLLDVTVAEVCLVERFASRENFGLSMDVLSLTIIYNTVKCWVLADLKLMLTPSIITTDLFSILLP